MSASRRRSIGYRFGKNFRLPNSTATVYYCHLFPYVQPNGASYFSGKSVRLFDDARSAASSHFGEAKKSKCPVGMRRMVKATPKANHKAPTHFQAAFVFQPKVA